MCKFAEEIVLGWCEVHFFTACAHPTMSKIDEQAIFTAAAIAGTLRTPTGDTVAQTRCFFGASQCDAYSCEQFIEAERLGQIIVGSQVKGLDFDRFLIMGRKYDDRHTAPFTEAAQKGEAVQRGQREVKQHQVGLEDSGSIDSLGSITHCLSIEASRL